MHACLRPLLPQAKAILNEVVRTPQVNHDVHVLHCHTHAAFLPLRFIHSSTNGDSRIRPTPREQ